MLEQADGSHLDESVFTHIDGASSFIIDTDDSKRIGTYDLRLFVRYSGDENHYQEKGYLDFTVEVYDKCVDDILDILESVLSETDDLQYSVYNTALVLTINPSAVSSRNSLRGCPEYAFDIKNKDGSSVDTGIFSFEAY